MNRSQQTGVVGARDLSEGQRAAVEELWALCNRHEGLDLPLELQPPDTKDDITKHFLYYQEGQIVGFADLEGVSDPELTGVVHPDHRRKGVGSALLDAAKEECRRRGLQSLLLAIDEAGESGRAFAKAVGGRYLYSEYRMLLDPASIDRSRPRNDHLRMRPAGLEELETLAPILSAAFGDPEDVVRRGLERGLRQPNQRYFVAELQGEPVGTLRVSRHDAPYITAFGVLPAHQGRGIGRQMLQDTVEMLLAEGERDVRIEVEIENRNALGLYQACGFKEATTYGYYNIEP